MNVALVYDRVNKWGGAERILLALHELFPEACLYTSVYSERSAVWASVFPKVKSSFLQKIPFAKNNHELFPWLMPIVFESFDFSEHDLVISVTSESSKGIITRTNTKHICYLLTPTRYLWSTNYDYIPNKLIRFIIAPIIKYLRIWDKVASNRPDKLVCISREVQKRAMDFYGRESTVVYPPVNIDQFNVNKTNWRVKSKLEKNGIKWGDYFLIVSRLVKYKMVDLAIRVFNKLELPLVIVGTGKEEKRLKKLAQKNVIFAGYVSDNNLPLYYKGCRALIFPQLEDFGLVAVEAQASGKPVIAYDRGGSQETVMERKTGIFFNEQNEKSLEEAIINFKPENFQSEDCIKNSHKFSKKIFLSRFATLTKSIR